MLTKSILFKQAKINELKMQTKSMCFQLSLFLVMEMSIELYEQLIWKLHLFVKECKMSLYFIWVSFIH